MKNNILITTAFLIVSSAISTGCNNATPKSETQVIEEEKEALDKANAEYQADVEKYRKESNERIEANNKKIAEFKARIDLQKQEAKDDYIRKITRLEQKNADIKKKMDDYKDDGKEKWQTFKAEFSRDMDELGQAFKDLTVKNN